MNKFLDGASDEFSEHFAKLAEWIFAFDLEAGPSLKLEPGYGDSVWSHAINEFKAGRRQRLSDVARAYLIDSWRTSKAIGEAPTWAIEAIAQIIVGTSKPDARGLKNRKLQKHQMLKAVDSLNAWRERRNKSLQSQWLEKKADELGIEIIEMKRLIETEYRRGVQVIADHYGVSPRTLENFIKPSARKN